jgi:hypothetical protein
MNKLEGDYFGVNIFNIFLSFCHFLILFFISGFSRSWSMVGRNAGF